MIQVIRGDARSLPLPDASVDLVVTSPPYFGLRDYRDDGQSLAGQIGSEATPAEWVAALVECTREWVRVLKPSGSIFVNLGDKYTTSMYSHDSVRNVPQPDGAWSKTGQRGKPNVQQNRQEPVLPSKSLMGLPWRYALACTDTLGLILRAEIIWAKPNGLPESVGDRVRRAHEQVFHLVKQPRYYTAVDEIREEHNPGTHARGPGGAMTRDGQSLPTWGINGTQSLRGVDKRYLQNPLGKLPGSVWDIASTPLTVPAHLGTDHFAAFPLELPRRIIAGWSPPGVCTACGEGRRPVSTAQRTVDGIPRDDLPAFADPKAPMRMPGGIGHWRFGTDRRLTGYACACTPYHWREDETARWKVYHFDQWTPPPARPALILDPFAGTGTTLLAAEALGRHAIGTDLSHDYCRLAAWRTTDPAERARAWQVPKPPPVINGQESLFDLTP